MCIVQCTCTLYRQIYSFSSYHGALICFQLIHKYQVMALGQFYNMYFRNSTMLRSCGKTSEYYVPNTEAFVYIRYTCEFNRAGLAFISPLAIMYK